MCCLAEGSPQINVEYVCPVDIASTPTHPYSRAKYLATQHLSYGPLKVMIHYATLLPATNVAHKIVAWNRTAFYSHNNVARNKVASNSHDTLRDFVAGNSCAQQMYHGS